MSQRNNRSFSTRSARTKERAARSRAKAQLSSVRSHAKRMAMQQKRESRLARWKQAFGRFIPLNVSLFQHWYLALAGLFAGLVKSPRRNKSRSRSLASPRVSMSRQLLHEPLEERAMLAADVFVDDNLFITTDVAPVGLSAGDTVTYASSESGETAGLTFGTDAFSTIQEGVDSVDTGGVVHVADGSYTENVLVDKNLRLLSANGRGTTSITGTSGIGSLGTVQVTNNTTDFHLGAIGQGFTIFGINGNGAIENGAVYFQGSHSGAQIIDNEIVANGDSGMTTEYGATIEGFVIDHNEFSGQTFDGAQPSGIGFSTQFDVGNNVPRQLLVMGGGTGGGNTSNITFTNNQITGVAGGISSDDGTSEQGNSLVTIDSQGATLSGNTFAGTTTRFGSALRARGSDVDISSNDFDGSNMGVQTTYLYVANGGTGNGLSTDPESIGEVLAENMFSPGALVLPALAGSASVYPSASIQSAIDALGVGNELRFSGNYTENVDLNVASILGGDFVLNGSLTVSVAGAVLDAGFSPGIMATGSLALSAGSTLTAEVDGDTPGTEHDQYVVTGTVDLGGATLDAFGTIVATPGDSIVLVENDGADPIVGAFDGIANGASVTINSQEFTVFYDGGDGNDVVLVASPAVATVYVDDDWAGTTNGADPDAGGPAVAFGIDAFATIQEAINAVDPAGAVIIYTHAGSGYNESLTITSKSLALEAAASNSPVIDGSGLFGTGLDIDGAGSVVSVDGLSFVNHFSDGINTEGDLTLIDSSITGGFNALVVNGGSADVDGTTISGASIFGVQVNGGGSADLDNSEITGNANAGVIVSDGTATLDQSRVTGNMTGVLVTGSGAASVHGSDLTGNTNKAIENATGTATDGSGNWWGTNDDSLISAATTGLVDFSPFLDSGTDTDSGAVGFIGDSSTLNVTTLGSQVGAGRIQEGVDLVDSAGTVNVLPGTYVENVVANKSVSLLGANAGVDPNVGPRGAETTIVPAISDIDGSVNGGMVVEVTADAVTVDGFTIDGDNTAIATGFGNNGADMDAAEGVASYSDIGSVVVTNNIIQNLSYSGVTLFGSNYSAPSSSDNVVANNLIQNMGTYDAGSGIDLWGIGVLIYNDQYTAITDNVMQDVRLGIQTGNFHDPNPGTAASQVITGNQIAARGRGIFHNLFTGNSSPITLSNNTITGIDEPLESRWIGILLSSLSDPSIVQNNDVDGSGITSVPSSGYQVWNVDASAAIEIDGGVVSGVDFGIWVNNFEGYNSDAGDTQVTISGVDITASDIGVYVLDSPSNTNGSTVSAVITNDNSITTGGAGTGIQVEGADASATISDNDNTIFDNQTGVLVDESVATLSNNTLDNNTTGVYVQNGGSLTMGSGNVISNGIDGIVFDGAGVGLTGLDLNNVSLSGQSGDYVTLVNGAFDDLDLDGSGMTLDGTAVGAMSNAQLLAAQDKITDEIDDSGVGLVELVANTIFVTPALVSTVSDNDYTRIKNAIESASAGDTIVLGQNSLNNGVFNWNEPNAIASWGLGNDGVTSTDDDWGILLPDNLNNVTVTADASDEITIQGPGDMDGANLEGVFVAFDNGTNTDWTFENFNVFDVDNAIGFYSAGDDYSGLTIDNLHIRLAADKATGSGGDANQNIAIHYARGTDISITNNLIEFVGTGDGSSFGIQSNTHGGSNYDGLNISDNTFTVLSAPTSGEVIYGVWENGHAHTSDIMISGNMFNGAGDVTSTTQVAFRVTSHSGVSSTVEYSGNTVDNASVAFDWLDIYFGSPQDYSGTSPVELSNNIVTNSGVAYDIGGIEGAANIAGGSVTGASGVGVDIASGSSAVVSGVTLQNLDVGVRVGGAAVLSGNFFDNASDNDVDVEVSATATAITIDSANTFGGENYFLENLSPLDVDLTASGSSFDEVDSFRIEDKLYHAPDDAGSGLVRVVAGELFVSAPGTGVADETIQRAIDAADAGDTVRVEAGTFTENLEVSKAIDLVGATTLGVAATNLLAASSGRHVELTGASFGADDTVTLSNFNFDGVAGLANAGVYVGSTVDLASLEVYNGSFTGYDFYGVGIFGDSVLGDSVDSVTLDGLNFSSNGLQGGGGTGDIQFFTYNNDASLSHLNLVGSSVANTGARLGIQFRGVGAGDGISEMPMGTVSLDNVDISGSYQTQMIGIQRYSDATGLSFQDVALGGAGSAISHTFGAAIRFDAVGEGAIGSPSAVDLGNTYFRGLTGPSTFSPGLDIEVAPDNGFTFLAVDAKDTLWDTSAPGVSVPASSLSQDELFEVEDRILHYVDGLHSSHGSFKGFVEVVDGSAYATTTFASGISRGVEVVDLGGTVHVDAGTYVEDVLVGRSVSVLGVDQNTTVLSGAMGGNNATVRVTADDVEVAGFTITREGNNVADWNDPTLNSAGIAVQGQAISGMLIHDNIITGNRTAIDVNNSNGHTIRNNEIVDNHTGMIFRNQTDNITVEENAIVDNRTMGVLFLDASSGSNIPVQTALGSTFTNNNISGNWYGQVVDRQEGGSLPAPGTTNLKDFSGNYLGTTSPVITTANSAEPGYSSLIPVSLGGPAVPPGGQPDIAGPGSANIDLTPYLDSGSDTDVETTPGRGTFGFQGDMSSLHVTAEGAQTGIVGRIAEAMNLVDDTSGGTIEIHAGAYTDSLDATSKEVRVELGASPGQVSINGNVTLDANDTLEIELDGTNAASEYDNLVVTGGIDLGGATLDLSLNFVPFPGDTFTILDNDLADAVVGEFDSLPEGSVMTLGGFPLTLTYQGGVGGNDVVLSLEQPNVVYVDADWAGALAGTDPDGPFVSGFEGVATVFGLDSFATIQEGIDAVAAGGQVIVFGDTYDEAIVVDKTLTLTAEADPDNLPEVDAIITSTTGGSDKVLVEVRAEDVTIDGFTVVVDRDHASGGIAASNVAAPDVNLLGGSFDNLVLNDNTVRSEGENIGSFDLPGGLSASAMGIALVGNGGTVHTVTLTGNVVEGSNSATPSALNPTGFSGFTRGIYLGQVQATVGGASVSDGNSAVGFAQDLLFQFASDDLDSGSGESLIQNNVFFLAGVDVSGPNANSPVNILDNQFSIQSELFSQSLLIRAAHNASSPVTVSGNVFTGHTTGVALDNSSTVTIDDNDFTADPAAVDYSHVVLDTNRFDSTSVGSLQSVGATITNNTFNGGGVSGNAILLTDSNTVSAPAATPFDNVVLGGAGDENAFASDLTNFLVLNPNGAGGAVGVDLDASLNLFDVGSGAVAPSAMPLADQFELEDRILHQVDVASLGFVNVVDGEVFVTTNSFDGVNTLTASIQRGIDAAASGDTVHVADGAYAETLLIGKELTLDGQTAGNVLLTADSGSPLIDVVGTTATDNVTIVDFSLDGNDGVATSEGVRLGSSVLLDTLRIENSDFRDFSSFGIHVVGNTTTGLSAQDVEVINSTFADNGNNGGGTGHISLFTYNGAALLQDLVMTSTVAGHSAIQLRGVGSGNGSNELPMGTVSFDNVDISGLYRTQMIGLQRYSDVDNLTFNDVKLGGFGSEITGSFGSSLRFDGVGSGLVASPAMFDLGNTEFRGLAVSSSQPHEIEFAPDNSFAFLRVDGTGTTWSGVAAGSLTLPQAFDVEDRILHFVDKLHPTHGVTFGAYKGFVDIQANQSFITDQADSGVVGDGSIQRGIEIVNSGGTVNIGAGTFSEESQVVVDKDVTVTGDGKTTTVLNKSFNTGSSGDSRAWWLVDQGVDLNINDLNFDGSSSVTYQAILHKGTGVIDNVLFSNITAQSSGSPYNGIAVSARGGYTGASGDVTIQNSMFQNIGRVGFHIFGVNQTGTFENNVYTGKGAVDGLDYGVEVGGGADAIISNNMISGNTGEAFSDGSTSAGVLVTSFFDSLPGTDGTTTATLSGNTFSANTTGVFVGYDNEDTSAVTITGDTIENNTSDGVFVIGGAVTVSGNASITGNGGSGVYVFDSGSGTIIDNPASITGNAVGITVDGGTALVENNDLNGNVIGVLIQNDGVADLGDTTGANITGLGTGSGPGGSSSGGNDFSGFTTSATDSAGAIVNLNNDAPAAGPQGIGSGDTPAFGNNWNDPSAAGIENVIYHDADDNDLAFIDYAGLANLVISLDQDPVNEGQTADALTLSGSFANDPQAHSVTIDWGDGSSDTLLNLALGTFSFDADHVYADNNDYTITVTVSEDAVPLNSIDDTIDVEVENVNPTLSVAADQVSTEGSLVTLVDLGSMTDPGFTTENFTYSITWGDGTASDTSSATLDNAGGVGVPSQASFDGSHTYADDGVYVVTVRVADDDMSADFVSGVDGTDFVEATFMVTVSNDDPTLAVVGDQAVAEGTALVIPDIGSFTDPGFDNPLNSGEVEETFTYSVDWGDGTASDLGGATIDTAGSEGVLTAGSFDGSHTYADDGIYTVTVSVFDDDGGIDTDTFQVTVSNVVPTLSVTSNQTVDEGALLSITDLGSLTDPGFDNPLNTGGELTESFGYYIDWGDSTPFDLGSPTLPFDVTGSPGVETEASFDGFHTYADNGLYTVTVRLADDDMTGDFLSGTVGVDFVEQTFTVTVENVAPTIVVSGAATTDEGAVYTLNLGAITDPGDDTVTSAVINWGDGEFDVVPGDPSSNSYNHTYDDGFLLANVVITLIDEDSVHNEVGVPSPFVVSVDNVDPMATLFNTGSVSEGSNSLVGFTAQSDVSTADTTAGFRYAFDFDNDGTFEIGDGAYAGSSASSTAVVPASFLDDGPSVRTIRGRILDKDGGFEDYTTDITVNNVVPVFSAGVDASVDVNTPFMRTLMFNDPGSEEIAPTGWIITVDYGDGSGIQPLASFNPLTQTFTLDHTYTATGLRTVTVTVDDQDGFVAQDTFDLNVVLPTFQVDSLTPNASGFEVEFNREADLTTLNIYDGLPLPVNLSDVIVTLAGDVVPGSMVWDAATDTLSFVKTGSVLDAGTYDVTLRSGSDAFQDSVGAALDGDGNGTPGDDFMTSFVVTSAGERIVSLPDFARGAGQDVNVPPIAMGGADLPITLDDGTNVTSVDVDVVYDPALLDITGATLGAGPVSALGWSITPNFVSPGLLKLTISGTNPLSGVDLELIMLEATVPATAPYADSQVIRLENLSINEDAIASKADASIHKAAYLGDVDGNAIYTGFDAALISRVVVDLDDGFDAHSWTDPAIVGDATGNGELSGQDASLIAQEAIFIDTPEVPVLPGIIVIPGTAGVDPELSIPATYVEMVGGSPSVAVSIDIDNSEVPVPGVISATFDVFYDDAQLSITDGDVQHGSFWPAVDGWSTQGHVVTPGHIRVVHFNTVSSEVGVGEIANLVFTIDSLAPGGISELDIEPVDPNEGGLTWTESDGQILIIPLGDMNGDGQVSDLDVNPFVQALTDRAAYDLAYPWVDADIIGDVNQDSLFNFGDLKGFKTLVAASSAATASAVPLQLGDMNGDGEVDFFDVNLFAEALTNRSSYDARGLGVDADTVGDINEDGLFNLGDVKSFRGLFEQTSQAQQLAVALGSPGYAHASQSTTSTLEPVETNSPVTPEEIVAGYSPASLSVTTAGLEGTGRFFNSFEAKQPSREDLYVGSRGEALLSVLHEGEDRRVAREAIDSVAWSQDAMEPEADDFREDWDSAILETLEESLDSWK